MVCVRPNVSAKDGLEDAPGIDNSVGCTLCTFSTTSVRLFDKLVVGNELCMLSEALKVIKGMKEFDDCVTSSDLNFEDKTVEKTVGTCGVSVGSKARVESWRVEGVSTESTKIVVPV